MGWLCNISSLALASLVMVLALLVHSSRAQNSPQDYLDVHNMARAAVGVGPMKWDPTLAAYARNYANRRINDCKMAHSGGPYGENLAKGSGTFTGRDGAQLWVREKKFYDYKSNSCVGGVCGHYTQVVWAKSVRLGCARARCSDGWWFVICSYAPAGNVIGDRPYVLRPRSYLATE